MSKRKYKNKLRGKKGGKEGQLPELHIYVLWEVFLTLNKEFLPFSRED